MGEGVVDGLAEDRWRARSVNTSDKVDEFWRVSGAMRDIRV